MASTYLTRTLGTPTNNKIWTFSAWVKRSRVNYGNYPNIFCANSLRDCIRFLNGDNIQVFFNEAGSGNLETSAKFRDVNAWYHIVVAVDTTQATASNRVKIYVNGEQITSFATENYPAQNYTNFINSSIEHRIGKDFSYTEYFDGYMSHIHFIDGTQYQASDFGETDATTGEWKIKTSPSVTYGNNGFFILKDGNSVTDQSPNTNNWTVAGGTLTKTEDCPSNVFCTMNPLQFADPSLQSTFANGNTSISGNVAGWQRTFGTIGAKANGKWYYEWKCTALNAGNNRLGWDSIDLINEGTDNYYSGLTLDGNGELRGGRRGYSGYDPNSVQMSAISGGNFSFAVNDFLGMALDIDNNTISVYKNGTLEINAYSFASASNCSVLKSRGHFISPSVNFYSASGNVNTGQFNFGNGAFGNTQLTGTTYQDSNGQGVFKYQPPTNYLAWCTKNLNV